MDNIKDLVKDLKQQYYKGSMLPDDWFEQYPSMTFKDLRDLDEQEELIDKQNKIIEDEFIDEMVRESPSFVKESMLYYLYDQISKIDNIFIINRLDKISKEDKELYGLDMNSLEWDLFMTQDKSNASMVVEEFYIDKLLDIHDKLKKKKEYYQRQIDIISGRTINSDNIIDDNDIENAKLVPIDTVIDCSGKRGFGNRVFIRSPFREERTPSFCIYQDTNSWFDYGASDGGDVIKLVEKLYNYEFIDAVKYLIGK